MLQNTRSITEASACDRNSMRTKQPSKHNFGSLESCETLRILTDMKTRTAGRNELSDARALVAGIGEHARRPGSKCNMINLNNLRNRACIECVRASVTHFLLRRDLSVLLGSRMLREEPLCNLERVGTWRAKYQHSCTKAIEVLYACDRSALCLGSRRLCFLAAKCFARNLSAI